MIGDIGKELRFDEEEKGFRRRVLGCVEEILLRIMKIRIYYSGIEDGEEKKLRDIQGEELIVFED